MEMCFRFHFNRKQSIQFTQLRARSIIYCTWLTAAEAAANKPPQLLSFSLSLSNSSSDSVAGDISKPGYLVGAWRRGRSKQASQQASKPTIPNSQTPLAGWLDAFGHSDSNRGEYCFVSCYVAVVEYYSMGILPWTELHIAAQEHKREPEPDTKSRNVLPFLFAFHNSLPLGK